MEPDKVAQGQNKRQWDRPKFRSVYHHCAGIWTLIGTDYPERLIISLLGHIPKLFGHSLQGGPSWVENWNQKTSEIPSILSHSVTLWNLMISHWSTSQEHHCYVMVMQTLCLQTALSRAIQICLLEGHKAAHVNHTSLKTSWHSHGTYDSSCCCDIWPLCHKYSSVLCKGITAEGGLCEVMTRVWSCFNPRCTSRKHLSGLIYKWLLDETAPLFWHC